MSVATSQRRAQFVPNTRASPYPAPVCRHHPPPPHQLHHPHCPNHPDHNQNQTQSQKTTNVPDSSVHGYDTTYFSRRRDHAYHIRKSAAKLARDRQHPAHHINHDENRYFKPKTDPSTNHINSRSYVASFTKGLYHNPRTGILQISSHYNKFVRAIQTGSYSDIQALPLGPPGKVKFISGMAKMKRGTKVRGWESMAAGLAYELEGPDSHAVTMPPAPKLKSPELAAEITELYWMALARDVPFIDFNHSKIISAAVQGLNNTDWIKGTKRVPGNYNPEQNRYRGPFTTKTIFRGVLPGDQVGPYISQFLWRGAGGIGRKGLDSQDGYVQYGAQVIDMRVRVATPKRDYLTTWASWLDAQNGADFRGRDTYIDGNSKPSYPAYRFILTPRDLATYVHYDALYQAYLTAAIGMLNDGIPLDPGLPFTKDDSIDKQQGFALFGGPHILTLVTEVATRALKAVRFQKFNLHRRARPEAICGLLEGVRRGSQENYEDELFDSALPLYEAISSSLFRKIERHNDKQNSLKDGDYERSEDYNPVRGRKGNVLLPMAYAEGSPMHPSYGAGHATVAGACVTMLKAFFNHKYVLKQVYQVNQDGTKLRKMKGDKLKLTIEGELNKLCSNVSIGRNWAGVHYYSDYIESIRMGERIAIGILEEQKLTYGENFKMTVPLFSGQVVQI